MKGPDSDISKLEGEETISRSATSKLAHSSLYPFVKIYNLITQIHTMSIISIFKIEDNLKVR
jgi:hypothetical protein